MSLGANLLMVLHETIDMADPASTSISHGVPLIPMVTCIFLHVGISAWPIVCSTEQQHLVTS